MSAQSEGPPAQPDIGLGREERSNEIVTRTLLIIWGIMNYFYETMLN